MLLYLIYIIITINIIRIITSCCNKIIHLSINLLIIIAVTICLLVIIIHLLIIIIIIYNLLITTIAIIIIISGNSSISIIVIITGNLLKIINTIAITAIISVQTCTTTNYLI